MSIYRWTIIEDYQNYVDHGFTVISFIIKCIIYTQILQTNSWFNLTLLSTDKSVDSIRGKSPSVNSDKRCPIIFFTSFYIFKEAFKSLSIIDPQS